MSETLKFISKSKVEFSSLNKRSTTPNGSDKDLNAKYHSFIERIYDEVLDARHKRRDIMK
ncbi:MAG: hypothetical protein ACTSRK_14525 [Promethearchaeota archaeon]